MNSCKKVCNKTCDIKDDGRDSIIMYYQNVNGLRTKVKKLKQAIAINDFKIYVMAETGLTKGFYDNELFTSDHILYRCDRSQLTY